MAGSTQLASPFPVNERDLRAVLTQVIDIDRAGVILGLGFFPVCSQDTRHGVIRLPEMYVM